MGAERPIGQIIRIIEKSAIVDFHALWLLDGLGILANVIEMGLQPNSEVSRVAVTKAVQLYRNACSSCKQIAQHSILGGSFLVLLDALNFTLKVKEILISIFIIQAETWNLNLILKLKSNPDNSMLLKMFHRNYYFLFMPESRHGSQESIVSRGNFDGASSSTNRRFIQLEVFGKCSYRATP